MPSLLDLMSPEDKAKAIARGQKRLNKNRGNSASISPELYITAEFGYYFGWDAIVAIKRGYIEKVDDEGETVLEPFTLDEVMALLEAAKKVWYAKLVETAHGSLVAGSAKYAKKPGEAFNAGMKPFTDRADLNADKEEGKKEQ